MDIKVVSRLELPGFLYPDAYQRVTLAVFWQTPWLYVAGADNGIYVIDASDPLAPVLVNQYKFAPTLRVGQVQVIGNLLMASAAEGKRTALLNVGKPDFPQPIAGGEFAIERESYFSNVGGGYALLRAEGGRRRADRVGHPRSGEAEAGGGLQQRGQRRLRVREGPAGVRRRVELRDVYDITTSPADRGDAAQPQVGDLDTVTPIANVAVLSVDDKADKDRGSIVVPYVAGRHGRRRRSPGPGPPTARTGLAVFSRFGLTFSEMIDVKSAWAGSVRLYETGTDPALTRVDGHVSTQENIVNFAPKADARPGVSYTLEVPAGGVRDYSGNVITAAFTAAFTVGGLMRRAPRHWRWRPAATPATRPPGTTTTADDGASSDDGRERCEDHASTDADDRGERREHGRDEHARRARGRPARCCPTPASRALRADR
jgi:hypothetical protein